MPPELLVILLNVAIVLVAYISVYPKVAGENINKIATYDLFVSAVSLFIVGRSFWGSDYAFSVLLGSVNWFWFTLITYTVIELPVLFWYMKKNNMHFNRDDLDKR